MNNGYFGMVRQWQELFWDKRYSAVEMGPSPDWPKLAEAFGGTAAWTTRPRSRARCATRSPTEGPVLLDVHVTKEENCYPMIPAGAAARDMVGWADGSRNPRPDQASRTSRPRAQLTGRKHILSILVENRPGVLARIAGLFSRRGFNIDTLAVGPTEDPDISRITLTLDGAVHPIDQVTKQLHKLVNVIKIRDMEPDETIAREMALFKVSAPVESRGEIMQFAEIFRAKIVDVSRRSLTDRGHRHAGQDRGLRADDPPARPDRDGAHGRGRDRPLQARRLAACSRARRPTVRSPRSTRLAERARGRPRRLASVTVELAETVDPAAAVFGSRLASDRWFCWEQPDGGLRARRRWAAPTRSVSRGEDRFADVGRACAEIARARLADEPADLPRGRRAGLGRRLRLRARRRPAPQWSSLPPALLVLPELSLVRAGGRALLTVSALVAAAGERAATRLAPARLAARARAAAARPAPDRRVAIRSVAPAERYEATVAAARDRIRAGELEKIVLAREVAVDAPAAHDPAAALRRPARAVPGLLLLLRRLARGRVLRRQPRAPRPPPRRRRRDRRPRGLDPPQRRPRGRRPPRRAAAAQRQGPQRARIVARRIERTLRPHSVWVEAGPEPGLVKVANIQHLATPIRAQLAEPRSAIELAALLHPTPAVGGEPRDRALAAIDELEEHGPRLVRRAGRLDGRRRGRRVLRRAALARCSATAAPTSTRAPASSPTPTPRPSSPRPRSSSGRCCR